MKKIIISTPCMAKMVFTYQLSKYEYERNCKDHEIKNASSCIKANYRVYRIDYCKGSKRRPFSLFPTPGNSFYDFHEEIHSGTRDFNIKLPSSDHPFKSINLKDMNNSELLVWIIFQPSC